MNSDHAKRIAEAVIEEGISKLRGVTLHPDDSAAVVQAIRSLDLDAIIASVPNEALAEQPEDERSRFEAYATPRCLHFAKRPDDEYASVTTQEAWEGWQAAKRDALTQAPQEPIKDHVIAKTVNELRDIALQFHDTQQLRERIAGVLVPVLRSAPQEPDWSTSKTLLSELWKNPLFSMTDRLLMADGAIRYRDEIIANLRNQLKEKT
jgi:hypothetical protein